MSRKKFNPDIDVQYDEYGTPVAVVGEPAEKVSNEVRMYEAKLCIQFVSKTPDELNSEDNYGSREFTLNDALDIADTVESQTDLKAIRAQMRRLVARGIFTMVKRGHYVRNDDYLSQQATLKDLYQRAREKHPLEVK